MFLPTPITWIKKTLAILKSDLSPNQIAFAFALGVFAGLPPMGLQVIIPCTLALLVRCSFRTFLISLGVFKLLSLAIAPASYAVGRWLLDSSRGLDGFWRWLTHLPVLAPMGYERYLLSGSVVLAFAASIPLFLLIRILVKRYRDSFAQWVSGWSVSKRLRMSRTARIARRFLAGGEAKYLGPSKRKGLFRYVRREMLIGLPVLYAICYLIAAVVVPFFAADATTSAVSWVAGTEVAVDDASFSLFSGTLGVHTLSIQNPNHPDENLIEIPSVSVNLGMLPLLSGRVVFDRVAIADASMHVTREEDGTLNIDNVTAGWDATAYIEWAGRYAQQVDWLGLLRNLLRYLSEWRPPSPQEDPYARYAGGRQFPDLTAPFAVKSIEIGRLLVSLEDKRVDVSNRLLPPLRLFEIEISDFAYPAALQDDPVRVECRGRFGDDDIGGFTLSVVFEHGEIGRTIAVSFGIERVDLAPLAALYETTLPVQVATGRATLSGSIRFEGEAVEGSVSFLLEDLRLASHATRPLFGQSVAVSDRIIDGINRYAEAAPLVFSAGVGGTAEAPSLAWEAPLLELAREGLLMLGRTQLESTIDQLGVRLDSLGVEESTLDPRFAPIRDQAEAATRDVIETNAGGLLEDLGILIANPSDAVQTDSSEATSLPALLEQLFKPADNATAP